MSLRSTLLASICLAAAAVAAPSHAQLLVGQDSGSPLLLGNLSGFPDVSYSQQLEFNVLGAAGRPEGGVYLMNSDSGAFSGGDIYSWDMVNPPEFIVHTNLTGPFGLGYGNGKLYTFGNFSSPNGIYEINLTTGEATLKIDTSTQGYKFFGLSFNPANDLLYGFTEYGNSGLYSINPNTGEMIRLAGSPPGSYGMFRGLAVGNNTVYLVGAHPTDTFYAYDLSQGVGGTYVPFTNPFTEPRNGAGAWVGPPPSNIGGCCTDNGCVVASSAGCAALGGTYMGDGAPCSACPTGACCLDTGCVQLTAGDCTRAGGMFQGYNTDCSVCPAPTAWAEVSDAADSVAAAQEVTGSGFVTAITGNNGDSDADLYKIVICEPANFSAATAGTGTSWDTQLWLFDANGIGVTANDDVDGDVQSRLTSQFVTAPGTYYLAVTQWDYQPVTFFGDSLWSNIIPESQPNGPGAGSTFSFWSGTTTAAGAYRVNLTGACFISSAPTCGTSDFNGDGDFGTDADIEAWFACLSGNCCPTCFVGGSDFNMDGDFGTDADIEAFFRVLAGGNC